MSLSFPLMFLALGLWFFAEGALFFLGAERLRPMLLQLAETEPKILRRMGFFSMCAGLGIIAIINKVL